MRHEESTLSGAGGAEIYWQAWHPDEKPRGTVVVAHGVSEHSGRYVHVARYLTDAGYAVYALDHRGHGRSQGEKSNIERLSLVIEDLHALVQLATERERQEPFLLGHSMGGHISIGYAIEHQDALAGLILSGAAVDPAAASPVERVLGRAASALAPNLGVFQVDPEGVSRDPEVVQAYVDDPLVHNGKLPARTVSELVSAADEYPNQLRSVTLPVLMFHGGADPIVPVHATEMVEENIGSPDKRKIIYDGLFHESLNEPEQDQVLADIVAWLNQRVSG